jgi:ethanolaminephosphotransferase
MKEMAPQHRRSPEETVLLNEDGRDLSTQEEQSIRNDSVGCFFYLQSESSRDALVSFQYQGEDRSLLYRFILSPLASFCVDYLTPMSVAPNTITLIGLVLMAASYCFSWYYVPNFREQHNHNTTNSNESIPLDIVPRWIFLYNAIAILIYQTLDNMDGKQARKTSSSSPLGLLFDHGCDAVNSLFGSVNWIISFGLNPIANKLDLVLCSIMLFGPYALFYIGTWEEYYTGKLILPICNGPNEGLLGAALISLASYFYGPEYWHSHSWWNSLAESLQSDVISVPLLSQINLRNADLVILASLVGFVQEIGTKVFFVMKSFGLKCAWTLLPFATLVGCFIIIGATSIDSSRNMSEMLWLRMPRTSLHLCAALFVEMVTDLMLRHITSQQYPSFRWILSPLVLLSLWMIFVKRSEYLTHTNDFLLIYTAAAATFLLMKMILVIHEICIVLDIWCFDIVTPRSTRTAAGSTTETQSNGNNSTIDTTGSEAEHAKTE